MVYVPEDYMLSGTLLRRNSMVEDEGTLIAELLTITSLLGGTAQRYEVTDSKGNTYKKVVIEYGMKDEG
tara:strand:+ start:64 stop:270 length:207 start_codon:yes stop_codon:yes gene_type:complete